MSLQIRKQFDSGKTIGYAIEDPKTGRFFDFSSKTFDANPDNSIQNLIEDWAVKGQGSNLRFLRGAYANVDPNDPAIVSLDTPTEFFREGSYKIYFLDRGDVDRVIRIEDWLAETQKDGVLEFFPDTLSPSHLGQGIGVTPDQPAPPQTIFNINLPPNLSLDGFLKVGVDLLPIPGVNPLPPGVNPLPGNPDGPTGPIPIPSPPEPVPPIEGPTVGVPPRPDPPDVPPPVEPDVPQPAGPDIPPDLMPQPAQATAPQQAQAAAPRPAAAAPPPKAPQRRPPQNARRK